MKNKKIGFYISIIVLLIIVGIVIICFLLNGRVKVVGTDSKKYIAYVKINPSVKLNYSVLCTKYSDNTEKCEEPLVDNYELVNDDAKEIFNGVNLLSGKKDLNTIINNICEKAKEKGIDITNVNVESDWKDINTYLVNKQNDNSNNSNNNNVNNNENKVNYNVKIEDVKQIENNVKEDVEIEEKAKAETEEQKRKEAEELARKEAEEKAKKEAQENARLASTIRLSDNVKYCHSMHTFECEGCFSNSLINTLKNAKGHYLVESNSSKITIKVITSLTNSYNKSTYFGKSYISKIESAGGEEVGGAGGCDEAVTKDVCKSFNLICE